jgi:hypothetical protein
MKEATVTLTPFKRAALAAAFGLVALVGPAGASEPRAPAPASKLDLNPESAPQLLALVRPQETEWRHLRVRWLTDVVAARRLAAKEDKPLVVLYTGGAGYNEPLGVC